YGPKYKAHATIARRTTPEKTKSLQAAYSMKGSPSFRVSSWYFCRYVWRDTTRPGTGHSLIPSFKTNSRCRPRNAISNPGIRNTSNAKNLDNVAPAMIGPPSSKLTSHDPTRGIRLETAAPIPNPQ